MRYYSRRIACILETVPVCAGSERLFCRTSTPIPVRQSLCRAYIAHTSGQSRMSVVVSSTLPGVSHAGESSARYIEALMLCRRHRWYRPRSRGQRESVPSRNATQRLDRQIPSSNVERNPPPSSNQCTALHIAMSSWVLLRIYTGASRVYRGGVRQGRSFRVEGGGSCRSVIPMATSYCLTVSFLGR